MAVALCTQTVPTGQALLSHDPEPEHCRKLRPLGSTHWYEPGVQEVEIEEVGAGVDEVDFVEEVVLDVEEVVLAVEVDEETIAVVLEVDLVALEIEVDLIVLEETVAWVLEVEETIDGGQVKMVKVEVTVTGVAVI
jgi:hypothetical protein